jgi:hypothetical protein
MRRLFILFLALGLIAGVPTAAADGLTSDCETFRAASIPILHPALNAGTVQLCDEDDDGAFDTVAFETRYVQTEGLVSVTDEDKQRRDGQDRDTRARTLIEPGVPGEAVLYQDVQASDDGNDAQFDRTEAEGGVNTHLGGPSYFLSASDDNGNGVPQSYTVLVCPAIACVGPSDVPQIPGRIDLPDTIVDLPVVGYVP